MRRAYILVAAVLLLPAMAEAAVLRVEKDGSGDFTVIQDAVDVAQSGDTIMIGPGRYSEVHDFDYFNGFTIQVCVSFNKSLSIVGAGRGETIIDPSGDGRNEYDSGGLAVRTPNLDMTVSDLTIANCGGNAFLYDVETGGSLEMTRVDIVNCFTGLILKWTTSAHIYDCNFQVLFNDESIFAYGAQGLLVEDCVFNNDGVKLENSADSVITNCRMVNTAGGVFVQQSQNITVSHCQIRNSTFVGLYIYFSNDIQVHDLVVTGETGASLGTGLVFTSSENLQITDCVFQGGEVSVYQGSPRDGFSFHGNHILPSAEGWTVWALHYYNGPDFTIDYTDNYWGTTDPAAVAASIHDANDADDVHLIIDFEPMADGPVSTTRTTIDGIKAMYR